MTQTKRPPVNPGRFTVIRLRQPEAIDDPLSEFAREGARRMLAQALTAEAEAFVALQKDVKLPNGRDRVVILDNLGSHKGKAVRFAKLRGAAAQSPRTDTIEAISSAIGAFSHFLPQERVD